MTSPHLPLRSIAPILFHDYNEDIDEDLTPTMTTSDDAGDLFYAGLGELLITGRHRPDESAGDIDCASTILEEATFSIRPVSINEWSHADPRDGNSRFLPQRAVFDISQCSDVLVEGQEGGMASYSDIERMDINSSSTTKPRGIAFELTRHLDFDNDTCTVFRTWILQDRDPVYEADTQSLQFRYLCKVYRDGQWLRKGRKTLPKQAVSFVFTGPDKSESDTIIVDRSVADEIQVRGRQASPVSVCSAMADTTDLVDFRRMFGDQQEPEQEHPEDDTSEASSIIEDSEDSTRSDSSISMRTIATSLKVPFSRTVSCLDKRQPFVFDHKRASEYWKALSREPH